MKQLIKKALSVLLAATFLFGAAASEPGSVFFADIGTKAHASFGGTCGDNLTWVVENGTLTIDGTGAMPEEGEDFELYVYWTDNYSIINSLVIGSGVTKITECYFENLSFNSITVMSGNTSYSTDDSDVLFNKDKTQLIKYPGLSDAVAYEIPSTVTKLSDSAFAYGMNLKTISIPESISTISIRAFFGCYSLTDIVIPVSVTAINSSAFAGCDNLTDVYYAGTEEDWNKITIGENNDCLLNATIHFESDIQYGDTDTPSTPTDTPSFDVDTSVNDTIIGILEDYVTVVIINGQGPWYVDSIKIDGNWYYVSKNTISLDEAETAKDKEIVAVISDGYVHYFNLLSSLTTQPAFKSNMSIASLNYKNGHFIKSTGEQIKKKQSVNIQISNLFEISSIDSSKISSKGLLELGNISVTLKSSDKDIIYFKDKWYNLKSDSKTIELENIRAGENYNLDEEIRINTKWDFPEEQKEHSVNIICEMTATLDGKPVREKSVISIKITNEDYDAKASWKKQTLAELIQEMENAVDDCGLDDSEKLVVELAFNAYHNAIDIQKLENHLKSVDKVWKLSCYITGLKNVTYSTAGTELINAIKAHCNSNGTNLSQELQTCLDNLAGSREFNEFIFWYYNERNVPNNFSKRSDFRCPVDVYVYDDDGQEVLSIINNEVVKSIEGAAGFVCEDDKIIYLPTDIDHNIKIVATGNGTMDYIVTEYASEGKLRNVFYEDIPLVVDEYYTGSIPSSVTPEAQVYDLKYSDSTKISYDEITYTESEPETPPEESTTIPDVTEPSATKPTEISTTKPTTEPTSNPVEITTTTKHNVTEPSTSESTTVSTEPATQPSTEPTDESTSNLDEEPEDSIFVKIIKFIINIIKWIIDFIVRTFC